MFKNVGREIRTWAKVFLVLQMIPIVVGAVAAAWYLIDLNQEYMVLGILAAVVIVLVGYLLARFSTILLYSWGELIVRVTSIDEKLSAGNAPVAPPTYMPPAYVHTPAPMPLAQRKEEKAAPEKPAEEPWICPSCGTKNLPFGRWCEHCGTRRER